MLNIDRQLLGREAAFEQLLDICSASKMAVEDQFQAVLEHCSEFLRLPVGWIGEISDGGYSFVSGIGRLPITGSGTELPMSVIPGLEAGSNAQVLAISSLPGSPYATHHSHMKWGFRTYIGAPIVISGEVVGSVSFAGHEPRIPPFEAAELSLVRLAAIWIGTQIELLRKTRQQVEREAQIAAQFRGAPAMMLIVNQQGVLTNATDNWLTVMGYVHDDVIGQPMASFLAPDQPPTAVSRLLPDRLEASAQHTSCTFLAKSGQTIDCENAAIALQSETGAFDRSLVMVTDVTERNCVQAALAKKNTELEQVNEQLRHYACVASHDLQEPLRKIRMFGDQLAEDLGDTLDGDTKYALNSMTSAAAKLSSLVSDVLSLSQVAYSDISLRQVDLGEIIEQVLKDLEPLVDEKSARIRVEAMPVVSGDPVQLQRMFQNLLSNALKYHEKGGFPEISVSLCQMEESGESVISIRDSGIGFDSAHAERIFHAFHRLNKQSEYSGSGIGLAIVHTIIERHGWHIDASGDVGAGATFRIHIPAEMLVLPERTEL